MTAVDHEIVTSLCSRGCQTSRIQCTANPRPQQAVVQPVGVDVQSGVRLDHAVEVKVVPYSTEVTKHAVMGVRGRRIRMHGPRDKTNSFSPRTQGTNV